jgi:hypothetical protein
MDVAAQQSGQGGGANEPRVSRPPTHLNAVWMVPGWKAATTTWAAMVRTGLSGPSSSESVKKEHTWDMLPVRRSAMRASAHRSTPSEHLCGDQRRGRSQGHGGREAEPMASAWCSQWSAQ